MDLFSFSQRRSPSRSHSVRSPSTASSSAPWANLKLPPPANPLRSFNGGGGSRSGSRFVDALFAMDDDETDGTEGRGGLGQLDADESYDNHRTSHQLLSGYSIRNGRGAAASDRGGGGAHHQHQVGSTVTRAIQDANDHRTMSSMLRRYDVDGDSIVGRVRSGSPSASHRDGSIGASTFAPSQPSRNLAPASHQPTAARSPTVRFAPSEAQSEGTYSEVPAQQHHILSEAYVRSSMALESTRKDLRNVMWQDPMADFEPRESVSRVTAAAAGGYRSGMGPSTPPLPPGGNENRGISRGTAGGAFSPNEGLMHAKVSMEAAMRYRVMSTDVPKDIDPDYGLLETPAALRFDGVDRRRGLEPDPFSHLFVASLPPDMLMGTASLGTNVSTMWDHEALRRGINDNTLYQDVDPAHAANNSSNGGNASTSMEHTSVSEEAAMFRMLRMRAGDQTLPLEREVQESAFNPVAYQDHVYQQYIRELKERGLKPPLELSSTERIVLAAVEHAPGVFVSTKFWDPFYSLEWWVKGLDHEHVLKYGNVSSADYDQDTPRYVDRFGNVIYGPMAMHPFRQFLVDYFAEVKAKEEVVKQIDETIAKQINNLWALETKLFQKYGKPKQTEPLSSRYSVKYPASAKITFAPSTWSYEIPEELAPKPAKEDKGGKGTKKGAASEKGGKKGAAAAAAADSVERGGSKEKGKSAGSKEKGGTASRDGTKEKGSKEKGGTKDKGSKEKGGTKDKGSKEKGAKEKSGKPEKGASPAKKKSAGAEPEKKPEKKDKKPEKKEKKTDKGGSEKKSSAASPAKKEKKK